MAWSLGFRETIFAAKMLHLCCIALGLFRRAVRRIWAVRNCVAFAKAQAQIGDASARPDYFRAVVGPAAERDCRCAGLGTPGRRGVDSARRKNSWSAARDAGLVARHESRADRRCHRAVVSPTVERHG